LLACWYEQAAFTFLPTGRVFAESLVVFALPTFSAFCVLQSCVHDVWARFFASSIKDDLRYTPSDCFETFPFPEHYESNTALEAVGKAYYEFRADLMVRNNEGLTKTYNRFHDPSEKSAEIVRLRELHAAMDRSVLDAYGGDLAKLTIPPCEFLLDYEDEEDGAEPTTGRQRKQPWRYRWPDAFRDGVLALLLELNKQRAEMEKLTVGSRFKVGKVLGSGAFGVVHLEHDPNSDKQVAVKVPRPQLPGLFDTDSFVVGNESLGGRHTAEELQREIAAMKQVLADAGPTTPEDLERWAAETPNSQFVVQPVDLPRSDPVQCAVFAPPEVTRGSPVLIQAFAFREGRADEASRLANEFDSAASRRGLTTLKTAVEHGQTIQFQLRLPFPVDPNVAEMVWKGETASVQFEGTVPKAQPFGDVIGTMLVTVEGVPVGQVKFKLTVAKGRKKATPAEPVLAAAHEPSRFRRAFVSYSSKDREVVEMAVGLLAVAGIDYFQDVRDLKPGEQWRPQLESAIDSCDLFLLFWSSNAKQSKEVQREIARALARLGPGGEPPPVIWPYAIEGPPIPPPPTELENIHFGHYRYLHPRMQP
jgi:hypothetical protein